MALLKEQKPYILLLKIDNRKHETLTLFSIMEIIYSNAHEALFEQLYQKIVQEPLSRSLLIFPSQALKSYYSDLFCERMGSTLSLDFILPDQIYEMCLELGACDPRANWQASHRSSDYQWILLQLFIEFEKNPDDEGYRKWVMGSPLAAALNEGPEAISVVAHRLATLFCEYSQWALSSECFSKPIIDWQSFLWSKVHERLDPEHALANQWFKLTGLSRNFHQKTPIHFVGFSQACPGLLKWAQSISLSQPLSWYVHSPSRLYWHDLESYLRSQKQLARLVASANTHDQLEALLLDRNPLLASLCQVARPLMQYLEEHETSSIDAYHLFPSIEDVKPYQDLWVEELSCSCEKMTLLKALQTDLLLMRSLHEGEPFHLKLDESLKVYKCLNPDQEVEVVKNSIIELLESEQELALSDIMVLAPDIHLYRGFIERHFDSLFEIIPYKILDSFEKDEEGAKSLVLALAQLATGLWSWENLLDFLEEPWIQKNAKGQEISRWLDSVAHEQRVSWGLSSSHRQYLAKQKHWPVLEEESVEEKGSWKAFWSYAFEKGVLQNTKSAFNPIESQGFKAARSLLGLLEKGLDPWIKGSLLAPLDWMRAIDSVLKELCHEKTGSFDFLEKLGKSLEKYPQEPLSGIDFNKLLKSYLEEKPAFWTSKKEGLLRFASLQPMRALPIKHLFILGLAQHHFPSANAKSDYEWSLSEQVGVRPKSSEMYRYAFLESLLSAREKITLTYSAKGPLPAAPCSILANLLAYLRAGFNLDKVVLEPALLRSFSSPIKAVQELVFDEKKLLLKDFSIPFSHIGWALKEPLRFYLYHRLGLSESYEAENNSELSIFRPFLDTYSRLSKMDHKVSEEQLASQWRSLSISHLEADLWAGRLKEHRVHRLNELNLDLQEPQSLFLSEGRSLLGLADETKDGIRYTHSKKIQDKGPVFEITGLTMAFDSQTPQIIVKKGAKDDRLNLIKALPSIVLGLETGLIQNSSILLIPPSNEEKIKTWDLSSLNRVSWLKTLASFLESSLQQPILFMDDLYQDLIAVQNIKEFENIWCSQMEKSVDEKSKDFFQQYMWGLYLSHPLLWKKCLERSFFILENQIKPLWEPIFQIYPLKKKAKEDSDV